jgi:hypothetical protein
LVLGLGISAYICYAKAKTVVMHDVSRIYPSRHSIIVQEY